MDGSGHVGGVIQFRNRLAFRAGVALWDGVIDAPFSELDYVMCLATVATVGQLIALFNRGFLARGMTYCESFSGRIFSCWLSLPPRSTSAYLALYRTPAEGRAPIDHFALCSLNRFEDWAALRKSLLWSKAIFASCG